MAEEQALAIHDINHINIAAPQPLLDAVRDFYQDVLHLESGPRPDFGVPGYWLYAEGRPLMHLIEWTREAPPAPGLRPYLDHIAFTCTGLDEMSQHLERCCVPYQRREYPAFGLIQLFLQDPTGLGVELNFQTDTVALGPPGERSD